MGDFEKKNFLQALVGKKKNCVQPNVIESLWEKREKNILAEKKAELERANLELDSFVYTASHDLKAPLRGIGSFSELLRDRYKDKLDEQGLLFLNRIINAVNRMSKLIDNLLTLSRLSRQKNPYEWVDINILLAEVLERIEFDINEQQVEIIIERKMPTIFCDRIKMAEVFLNLIHNGIKFSSKKNKQHPQIRLGYKSKKKYYQFFIKDNGIGIEPQYHEHIFGIFKRLHSESEYEGTGAGLSIVKRIIDDHKGRIWVESQPGKGAEFLFSIPKMTTHEPGKMINMGKQDAKEL